MATDELPNAIFDSYFASRDNPHRHLVFTQSVIEPTDYLTCHAKLDARHVYRMGITFSLFLGWIDYTKGFKDVFVDLEQHLKGHYHANDCMASDNIGESEAPMLYYYTKILHQRQDRFENQSSAAG